MLAFFKRPWVMALLIVVAALYFRETIFGILPTSVKKFFKAA